MKVTSHGEPGNGQPLSDLNERALSRCREARVLKEAGDLESARRILYELWPPESIRPRNDGLGCHAAAELLLLAGMITSSLGSAKHIPKAQARARKLIVDSVRLFEQAGLVKKVAEACAELAWCQWKEGDHEGARHLLWKALAAMGDDADGLGAKLVALLRAAIFEERSNRLAKALGLLRDAAPLFDSCDNSILLGKFHNNLGIIFQRLGEAPGREDFLDLALIEYTAASFHFKQAEATRLCAHSENNHGSVLTLLGKFDEAAERLECARALFTGLADSGHAAQVDETRARLLLAEGLYKEAERVAAEAVSALEAGERPPVLAEALTTWGVTLARAGRPTESCAALMRAIDVAEKSGARDMAGAAALSAVEELWEWLDPEEAINLYEVACLRLEGARNARTDQRLSKAARMVYAPWRARNSSFEPPNLWASARRLSSSNSPALVTGKGAEARRLLACYAHALSGRPGRFVVIHCDTIEDEAPRPEFFNWAAREAVGGTLFLDRVDELSRHLQSRLLCLIKQSFVGHAPEMIQGERLAARIVAGTSCDLSRYVALECFDASLFDALGGCGPHITPSAKELEELRLLAGCFDEEAFGYQNRTSMNMQVDDDDWSVSFDERVTEFESELIRKALVKAEGQTGKAACLLHKKRQTLESMINNPKYQGLKEWRTPVIKRGRAVAVTVVDDEENT